MKKFLSLATIVVISSGLYACGGGGGTPGSTDTTLTGQFVDSVVANLEYQTSSGITGRTDINGYFKYKAGDTVTFKVGKVVIGETKGQELVTPLDLVADENAAENDTMIQEKVKLISAFLISLDNDGNPDNGIEIEEAEIEKLQENVTEEVNLEKVSLADSVNGTVDAVTILDKLPLPEDLKGKMKEKFDEGVVEEHLSGSVYGLLKNTLNFLNGKTVLLGDETCTFVINGFDESNQTITAEFTNCTGEDDNVTFKVEEGIPYLYEGDGFKDMIIELEPEEFCVMTLDIGEVCIKLYEEGHLNEIEESEESEDSFNAADLKIDAFKNKKIVFNNGRSYLVFDNANGFELYDGDERGDGAWIYDEKTKSIVLWPGQSYEYRLWFSSSEPMVGTKIKISMEGGERVRYDLIVSVQQNVDSVIGTYRGSYVTESNPTGYCDPGGNIEISIDMSGIVKGYAVTIYGDSYNLFGKYDFSNNEISASVQGSDGSGVLKGKLEGNIITGTWKFTSNEGAVCSGTFSVVKQ